MVLKVRSDKESCVAVDRWYALNFAQENPQAQV